MPTELPNAFLIRCYIHILALLCRKDWVSKHLSHPNNKTRILQDIVHLHRCTTHPQFCKLAEMCGAEWRVELEEAKFANYFTRYLGPTSACAGMWWIGCMERFGLTPDNQAVEEYFRQTKGFAGSKRGNVRLNSVFLLDQCLYQFVKHELPKLVCYDATNRSGVDNYRRAKESMTSFSFIPKEWLAHAAMITRADIFPVPGTSGMFLVPKGTSIAL